MVQNKLDLVKNFYIQPSEIERMPFWEYEELIHDVNEYIKREEKRQKEEESKYSASSFKMPNLSNSNFKLPK